MKPILFSILLLLISNEILCQQDTILMKKNEMDTFVSNMEPTGGYKKYYEPHGMEYSFNSQKNTRMVKKGKKFILLGFYPSGAILFKTKVNIRIDSGLQFTGSKLDNDTTPAVIVMQYFGISYQGVYREYYPNGKIKVKGFYNWSIPRRRWKYYNIDGTLESKKRYR